ncbi:anti-sigma factor [Pseudomaricurvus alkylphenolicus]|uniref:ChrR family anti-sigma-E factor n=1 Tax=Pseudomaricurvus alkylphenolicus TaxID=1306991 RepID=UPI001420F4B2|nr:ChrR family anti-sigma-E factor [Pseudomaricurvus alkylphenolicus]NIB43063.1 anti-sigma factor [Pseudomaricurvus alkylphenolicus]
MIQHHPSIDRLIAFSAGSLPLSQSLCISAHIEHCQQCRQDIRRLNHIGSTLIEELPPSPVPDALKQAVMERINQIGPRNSEDTAAPPGSGDVPRCLRSLLPAGLYNIPWKRLSPSIFGAKLCTDVNGSKIEMLKIKAGGQVANHNHTGEEITLVLEGSFSDADGVYRKGDIIFRNCEDKNHRPIASQNADCICLTAVEAPIQFTGFFARLLNPLIRRSHYSS